MEEFGAGRHRYDRTAVKIQYCWEMHEATTGRDSPMLSLGLTMSSRAGLSE